MAFYYNVWEPTSKIRWLKRNGETVLQQLMYCYESSDKEGFMMYGAKLKEEWTDVEVAVEVVEDVA